MKHEQAWKLLPDLLEDLADADLLAHVRACPDCQRQLFLLGRVDRMLRDRASTQRSSRRPRRSSPHGLLLTTAVSIGTVAAVAALVVGSRSGAHTMMLRTASGRAVGQAVMAYSDARNVSLALTARGLPVKSGQVYVLWAGDSTRLPMQVGRFMVDRTGGCRVRFNLPATHKWKRFWVTAPGNPSAVVAST